MLIREVTEAKASAELCKSSKPNDALSASDLSSCKSQGLRARETKRKYKIAGQTQGISGKKVRGKKYGGNLPAHGQRTVSARPATGRHTASTRSAHGQRLLHYLEKSHCRAWVEQVHETHRGGVLRHTGFAN